MNTVEQITQPSITQPSIIANTLYITSGKQTKQIAQAMDNKLFNSLSANHIKIEGLKAQILSLDDFTSLSTPDKDSLYQSFSCCYLLLEDEVAQQKMLSIQEQFSHENLITVAIFPASMTDKALKTQKTSKYFPTLVVPCGYTAGKSTADESPLQSQVNMNLYQQSIEKLTTVMCLGISNTGIICMDFEDYKSMFASCSLLVWFALPFNDELTFKQALLDQFNSLDTPNHFINKVLVNIIANVDLRLGIIAQISDAIDKALPDLANNETASGYQTIFDESLLKNEIHIELICNLSKNTG